MKAFIESITGGYSASAKVVDGTLIISLPDAVTPIVWRMDLSAAQASALEVRTQDDGLFMLTLKTPRGDVHDIAPFANRPQAVRALMAVSRAMEQSQGQMRPAIIPTATIAATEVASIPAPPPGYVLAPARRAKPSLTKGQWVALLFTGLVIFGLYKVSQNLGPRTVSVASSQTTNQPPASTIGVPMSADQFLQGR